MLECVVNISEGRRADLIDQIGRAAGPDLLDVHTDADHHRSVYTLIGEAAARAIAATAVELLDLGSHDGVHPRIGVVDVVPFVPIGPASMTDAIAARDAFAVWAGQELALPSFSYGPERTLPEVRRDAWTTLVPDHGPTRPHPTAGAAAVGARPVLVAYNVWLRDTDLAGAKAIAALVRRPGVRTLGLVVGDEVQVSMNLVDPDLVGPAEVYDLVAEQAPVARAELVGLVPQSVLDRIDRTRWDELDLAETRTIEHRLAQRTPPAR